MTTSRQWAKHVSSIAHNVGYLAKRLHLQVCPAFVLALSHVDGDKLERHAHFIRDVHDSARASRLGRAVNFQNHDRLVRSLKRDRGNGCRTVYRRYMEKAEQCALRLRWLDSDDEFLFDPTSS